MDKNVRNMLIGIVVSGLVGIIMGVGLVAPSIERPDVDITSKALIDVNVELASKVTELQGQSDECQGNFNILQGQFDQCMEQATKLQELALTAISSYDRATELLDQCIESLENSVGVYQNVSM